ncbi:symmetrical bis(5'-nucleosyl)-tetraphosphatase [Comamonadaceae bacterium G21597-S1]|nr:symmetrical bis(5'-nucleosyl)-tetraphosphatase [Comamonadaceae bacterium G21597-S1]
MALYLIGDVQGCDRALERLLAAIDFSPSRDRLVLLGDLVNRGPDSLGVLRRVMALDGAARCVLGNHDLHLLAIAHGVRPPHRKDTVDAVLRASDRAALLDWLRAQPLALLDRIDGQDLLMVHAGVLPSWTAQQALALAQEVAQMMASDAFVPFLHQMYGDTPERWSQQLHGVPRWRVIVNALTRLRFCDADDRMEFATKDDADAAPAGFLPWFDVPGRRTATATVAFGHWSTLSQLKRRDVIALDTGCVWGGRLSAARIGTDADASGRLRVTLVQVPCSQAQRPGR